MKNKNLSGSEIKMRKVSKSTTRPNNQTNMFHKNWINVHCPSPVATPSGPRRHYISRSVRRRRHPIRSQLFSWFKRVLATNQQRTKMKVFVVLSAVFACVLARPSLVPLAYTAPVAHVYTAPVEISSQFHAQDSLGQYSYGYAGGLSAKSESRSFDGVTSGGYSYVDANGELQHVSYVADPVHGFKVAASNLPVAPEAPVPCKSVLPRKY